MDSILAETIQEHTQTSGIRNEIDEIFAPTLLVQGIFGLQILDPRWSWKNNVLPYVCIVLFLIYTTIGTVEFLKTNDDILLFTEGVFSLLLGVQYSLKVPCFVYYRLIFCEGYFVAKTTIFGIIKDYSAEKTAKVLANAQKMVRTQLTLVIVTAVNYLGISSWNYLHGIRVPLSRTTSILMPMTSPYFELGCFLHFNFVILTAFGLLVVDLWFIFFTYLFCSACECAVKILDVKRLARDDGESYGLRLNEALREFYSVHVKLMEYLNTLNRMYKWPILIPLVFVLISTCIFLLVITEKPNYQIATVMLSLSVEIFAYNLLGEQIKNKANDLNMALLNFDWPSMRLKDKKNYYIMICYMNKEFGIKSAVGVDLSLLTLSAVYKGSYQAFAVLNTMKNK